MNKYFLLLFVLLTLPGISAQELASQEHDTGNGTYNSIVQVDADTYAIAYTGTGDDGYIATFTISSDGTSITEVASLEHDTDNGIYNSIVQVDADTYVLAYTGTGDDGYIKTFTISSDGTSITEEASLEHDTGNGTYNSIVQVDADTYALAYTSNNENGYITTFTISADGTSITEVASEKHGGVSRYSSIVQVDSDTYVLAATGNNDDGYIKTFTISSDGTTITKIRAGEHDTDYGTYNSIVQVDADTYVLAYTGTGDDGFIKTFTISSDGTSITEVASLEHDGTRGDYNSIVQVDSDTYALAYRGESSDGYIATFTISADGTSITEVASFEHDGKKGDYNSIVQVDADTYALAYSGETEDGFIKTFTIQSDGSMGSTVISGNAGFRMMSSPLAGQIYSDLLNELWTQGMTGADVTDGTANVWTLSTSGSQSSSSWTALTDISGSGSGASLTAGQGFLVYVFTDTDNDGDDDLPVTLSISGTYNSSSSGSDYTLGSVPDGNYALAGNPFPYTIDWDNVDKTHVATVYVWDDASSAYKSWNGTGSLTDGLIAPLQGFLFLASGGIGSITINVADKSSTAGTFYKTMNDSTGSMSFSISSGDYSDQTYVSFMNNGQEGIDNSDAYKLLPMTASERVVGISYAEGSGLDINNLPVGYEGSISIPLDIMYLTLDDDYNFVTQAEDVNMTWDLSSLPEHISMTLTDNITGNSVDLTQQSEVTFATVEKGSFPAYGSGGVSIYPQVGESRFTLTAAYSALSAADEATNLPKTFALHQNYPNPFNPVTTLRYDIPENAMINITIYDMLGRQVKSLINQTQEAGYRSVIWNATNNYGKPVSAGVYLYQIQAGEFVQTRKMVLLK